MRADALRGCAGEIAEEKNVGKHAKPGRLPPVIHGWQGLLRVRAVCAGFEPAHASDGKISLVLGKSTQFPPCRSRPAGGVAERGHGLLERNFAAALSKWISPVFPIAVTAGVEELSELPVGNLEPVHEVIGQRHD